MAAMSSLRRPPVTWGSLSKSLVFKWSSRIILMKKKQKKRSLPPQPIEEAEAPSGLRRHRPLRPRGDDLTLIQHLPRRSPTTLEFEADHYHYSCEFPEELLREILVRLPSVECIIKCTAVCKSWRSVIKSPTFIDARLSRSLNRNGDGDGGSLLLLVRGIGYDGYDLYWDNKPSAFGLGGEFFPGRNTNCKSVVTPLVFESSYYREQGISSRQYFNLAGICNGLMCLANDFDGCYRIPTIICNPLLRKFVALPRPSIAVPRHKWADDYFSIGLRSAFGYDPGTRDYKVLRLSLRDAQYGVELYSLARGSWKSLTFHTSFDHMFERIFSARPSSEPSHVVSNAALHWLLSGNCNDKETVIVSFDMVTESFQQINIPQALATIGPHVCLSILEEDSLALIEVDLERPCCDLNLWVMQQYGVAGSWTKLYSVPLGNLNQYPPCSVPYPVFFGSKSNGEQVFRLGYGYNSSSGHYSVLLKVDFRTKHVDSGIVHHPPEWNSMDTFVESLVLLNQPNALSY